MIISIRLQSRKEGRRILDNLQNHQFLLANCISSRIDLDLGTYAESPATFVPSTDFMGQYGNDNHFILCTRVRVARSRNHEAPTKRSKARNPIWLSFVSDHLCLPTDHGSCLFIGYAVWRAKLTANHSSAKYRLSSSCLHDQLQSCPSRHWTKVFCKTKRFSFIRYPCFIARDGYFLPVGQQLIGTVSLTMTQQLLIGANVILLFLVVEIEKGSWTNCFAKEKQLENTVASRYYKSFESEFSQTIELIFVGIEEMYTIGISRESRGKLEIKISVFQRNSGKIG